MFIADLHIHAKYSRATSQDCIPELLDQAARQKGLLLLGTGDCTHAAYRAELREQLEEAEDGLYRLKPSLVRPLSGALQDAPAPRFIISGEISTIYKQSGKVRKIHHLILFPSLSAAEELSRRLEQLGCNLHADGRPIIGLSSHDLLELTLDACPQAIFIPAHIWTPHFSLFGAYSGFDTVEECFGDLTPQIHALETGLSGDPPMHWRLSQLDRYALVSNSDAHSPARLAREANLFSCELSYPALSEALSTPHHPGFYGTIEFFPEEGKYHYDGHRNCHVSLAPAETEALQGVCPVCGGRLTVGVLHRADALADRPLGFHPPQARPFESLVPLVEVIAASSGLSPNSVKARRQYDALLQVLGPELRILRETPLELVEQHAGICVAEGLRRLRAGEVRVTPGFDGEYGKVSILDAEDIDRLSGQASLFACSSAEEKFSPDTIHAEPATNIGHPAQTGKNEKARTDVELNAAQLRAVHSTAATTAVIAGPGTGKTKTLISRVIELIETRGAAAEEITAVTFTNKAAAELQERLKAHFHDKRLVREIHVGTFHSLCLRLLTAAGQAPVILDGAEARSIAADLVTELGLKSSAKEALSCISRHKNTMTAAENVEEAELVAAYQASLQQLGALDFDDILSAALQLCEQQPQRLGNMCRHLLVDEFQDINEVQYRLIRAWQRQGETLFVIGDPDQAIYGFRGASADCFTQLQADQPDLELIRLTKNYRSTPEILAASLPVINKNPGAPRQLQAARPHGDKLRHYHTASADPAFQEAIFIAKEINRLVGGIDMLQAHAGGSASAARSFRDIAVLYRTHRQAEMIAYCLEHDGIPYTAAGREELPEDDIIRDTLAFFRFLLNPADLISLRRTLLASGASLATQQQLCNAYAGLRKKSVAGLIKQIAALGEDASLHRFAEQVAVYTTRVRREKPHKLLSSWIEENHLSGIAALEDLCRIAVLQPSMSSLLQTLALGLDADIVRNGSQTCQADAVRLMTLHAAKGLEFPVVFLCGIRDGCLPLQIGGSSNLEEERRLFFVGMTRAAETLYLLTGDPPSPFFSAIPKAQLETIHPQQRRPQPLGKQLSLFD